MLLEAFEALGQVGRPKSSKAGNADFLQFCRGLQELLLLYAATFFMSCKTWSPGMTESITSEDALCISAPLNSIACIFCSVVVSQLKEFGLILLPGEVMGEKMIAF